MAHISYPCSPQEKEKKEEKVKMGLFRRRSREERRRRRRERRRRRREKIKKFFQKLKKGAKRLLGSAVIAPFLPFIGLAKKYVKSKGLEPEREPRKLLLQVYKLVKGKSFEYEYEYDAYEKHRDVFEVYDVEPVITTAIVSAVIGFLKELLSGIKRKKEQGIQLTETEQDFLETSKEVAEKIKEASAEVSETEAKTHESEDGREIKSALGGNMLIIAIAVAAVLLFMLMRRK